MPLSRGKVRGDVRKRKSRIPARRWLSCAQRPFNDGGRGQGTQDALRLQRLKDAAVHAKGFPFGGFEIGSERDAQKTSSECEAGGQTLEFCRDDSARRDLHVHDGDLESACFACRASSNISVASA